MPFFGDANRHGLVFVGIEAANHRGSGSQGDFMFTASSAEENAYAQPFFGGGHESSVVVRLPFTVYRRRSGCTGFVWSCAYK